MHHLHAGVFHGLELLDHPFEIPLLARVQGGLAALVDPFVGPVQFTKARLVGEELRTLPLEIPCTERGRSPARENAADR